MRLVIAEDLALLRDGLTRLFEAHDIEVVAAVDNAVSLAKRWIEQRSPTSPWSTYACRRRSRTRACSRGDRHSRAPAGVPGAGAQSVRRAAVCARAVASGEGSVGYLLKDRVTDVRTFVDSVRQVAGGGTVLDPEGRVRV